MDLKNLGAKKVCVVTDETVDGLEAMRVVVSFLMCTSCVRPLEGWLADTKLRGRASTVRASPISSLTKFTSNPKTIPSRPQSTGCARTTLTPSLPLVAARSSTPPS